MVVSRAFVLEYLHLLGVTGESSFFSVSIILRSFLYTCSTDTLVLFIMHDNKKKQKILMNGS